MLYIGNGQSSAVRLQGTFVTDDEIERIIEHVQNEATPNYLFGQEDFLQTVSKKRRLILFLKRHVYLFTNKEVHPHHYCNVISVSDIIGLRN